MRLSLFCGAVCLVAEALFTSTLRAQDSLNMHLVGSYGEPTIRGKDLEIIGHYGYLALAGGGLVIEDWSNPTEPQFVRTMFDDGAVVSLAADENHVCVVELPNSLHLLQVQEPNNPSILGSYRGLEYSADSRAIISGAYIFVTDEAGRLSIFYRFGPRAPEYMSTIDSIENIVALAGNGQFVYAVGLPNRLYTIDAHSPYVPGVHWTTQPVSIATNVTIVHSHIILYDSSWHNSRAYDISDPANPTYQFDVQQWGPINALSGNTAYSLMPGEGLRILDISNYLFPRRLGATSVAVDEAALGVLDSTVYILGRNGGVWGIDCSVPAHSSLNFYAGGPADQINDVRIEDDLAIISDGEGGVQVLDLQNREQPVFARSIQPAGAVLRIDAKHDLVGALDAGNRLRFFDMGEDSGPRELRSQSFSHANEGRIAVGDSFACAGGNNRGFIVFDVRSPDTIRTTISVAFSPQIYDLDIEQETAYLAVQGGIQNLFVGDPNLPVYRGFYEIPNIVVRSIDHDGIVLCALAGTTLHVFSIANPDHLVHLRQLTLPREDFSRLAVNYPYCAVTGWRGVVVYNIGQQSPVEIGHYYDETRSFSMCAIDSPYVYVGSEYSLFVLRWDALSSHMPEQAPLTVGFDLVSIYPNPFNGSTRVWLDVVKRSRVSLRVYDLTGRTVQDLGDQDLEAGRHEFLFDANRLASGTYYIEALTAHKQIAKAVQLIR